MFKKNKILMSKTFYILITLVLCLITLGGVFTTTFAYIKGVYTHNQVTKNPYLKVGFYSGATALTSIEGSVSSSGVTLKVNGSNATLSSLNINIKNTGNIIAEIREIYAYIDFYDASGKFVDVDKQNSSGLNYLTLKAGTGFTINDNTLEYSFNKMTLNSGANSNPILSQVQYIEDIKTSALVGKTFKIHFIVTIAQEGFDNVEVSI